MRCPITYDDCPGRYSSLGLKKLSVNLTDLHDFPYSAEEQRREAAARATKISIQGIQPKLSVRLNVKRQTFEIIDKQGQYILKPQSAIYEQLPENESLTMRLAQLAGIATPLNGLIHTKGNSLTYFIKRFDRYGRNNKRALEDFAQLSGKSRDTKYDSSMEKVAEIIENSALFPHLKNPSYSG